MRKGFTPGLRSSSFADRWGKGGAKGLSPPPGKETLLCALTLLPTESRLSLLPNLILPSSLPSVKESLAPPMTLRPLPLGAIWRDDDEEFTLAGKP